MKKRTILTGLAMLAVSATAIGGASQVMAAGNVANFNFFKFGKEKVRPVVLTEAQKTEIKAKLDAIKTAETAGNYDAWVIAVKAMDANSPLLKRVKSANDFKTYIEQNKAREAKMTAEKSKKDAITTAITAGNYDAWVTATKAQNANCPLLEKINASNFAKYAEAIKLRTQADTIMKELGLEGERGGFGPGEMRGGQKCGKHKGFGEGMNRK